MDKVGEIGIDLVLNKQKFNQEANKIPNEAKAVGSRVSNALNNTANSVGSKITNTLSGIGRKVAAVFSVAAITGFTKKLVQSSAQVQAANSQFEQTFGDLSDSATAAMKKVADESGIVQSRLQGVGTSIFAFAKTTGMDSANALNMMREALQVTADSAAYYDRSLEDTAESLKSFLKGNYANDAALGLSCTETTRNAAANKLYGQSFRDLSEAQKQLTLLQMVKDANAASGALGQAARESDGLENVLGNLKEAWNQLLGVIGKPVLNGAVAVIKRITEWLQRMTMYAKAAVSALSDLFGWKNDDSANTAQATSDAIGTAVDNQSDLTKEVKKTNDEVKRGLASFDRLNVIAQSSGNSSDDTDSSSPLSNLGSTINSELTIDTTDADTKLGALKTKLSKMFEPLVSAYNKYIKPIGAKVASSFDRMKGVWQEWKSNLNLDPLKTSIENILSKLDPLVDAILPQIEYIFENVILPSSQLFAEKILPTILNLIASIIGFVTPIIAKIGAVLQPLWENILWPALQKIGEWFNKIGDKIGPKLEEIGHKIGSLLERLGPLVELLSSELGPLISNIIDVLGGSLSDGLGNLIDTIGDIIDILSGLIGFVSGVLTGDWKKAWDSIKDCALGAINFIIDILNSLWITVYSTFAFVANTIGGLIKVIGQALGRDDWGWEISTETPLIKKLETSSDIEMTSVQSSSGNSYRGGGNKITTMTYENGLYSGGGIKIPHMAHGNIVKAPTLALVGDNAGAGSGNPEVVAPLSDLERIMGTGRSEADTTLLKSILEYIKKLYEQFIIFKNNGGNSYQFVATLSGEVLFNEFVREVNLYKQRHHGAVPW